VDSLTSAGLAAVEAPSSLWRVFPEGRGPLNPPIRFGQPQHSWSRYDQPGWATLYGAREPFFSLVETLSYAKFEDFDYANLFPNQKVETVSEQWRELSHMKPGQTPKQWRTTRKLVELSIKESGFLVDISHHSSILFLRATVTDWFPDFDGNVNDIDLAMITGSNRGITSRIAWWVAQQSITTNEKVLGLQYPSRHGANGICYAFWLNPSDFSPTLTFEKAMESRFAIKQLIDIPIDELQRAAKSLGVSRIF